MFLVVGMLMVVIPQISFSASAHLTVKELATTYHSLAEVARDKTKEIEATIDLLKTGGCPPYEVLYVMMEEDWRSSDEAWARVEPALWETKEAVAKEKGFVSGEAAQLAEQAEAWIEWGEIWLTKAQEYSIGKDKPPLEKMNSYLKGFEEWAEPEWKEYERKARECYNRFFPQIEKIAPSSEEPESFTRAWHYSTMTSPDGKSSVFVNVSMVQGESSVKGTWKDTFGQGTLEGIATGNTLRGNFVGHLYYSEFQITLTVDGKSFTGFCKDRNPQSHWYKQSYRWAGGPG